MRQFVSQDVLNHLYKELKLSQSEIARQLGVSRQAINQRLKYIPRVERRFVLLNKNGVTVLYDTRKGVEVIGTIHDEKG